MHNAYVRREKSWKKSARWRLSWHQPTPSRGSLCIHHAAPPSICLSVLSFRHNNEIYHIRIYTQDVDGATKHYLVDGLHFDSLQVGTDWYSSTARQDTHSPVLVLDPILSNALARRSLSSCEKLASSSNRTRLQSRHATPTGHTLIFSTDCFYHRSASLFLTLFILLCQRNEHRRKTVTHSCLFVCLFVFYTSFFMVLYETDSAK